MGRSALALWKSRDVVYNNRQNTTHYYILYHKQGSLAIKNLKKHIDLKKKT